MLAGKQRGQEAHQFERIGELVVADLPALLEVVPELAHALSRQVDDPSVGTLMLRPGLYLRVLGVAQLEVARMEVEAGGPAIEKI